MPPLEWSLVRNDNDKIDMPEKNPNEETGATDGDLTMGKVPCGDGDITRDVKSLRANTDKPLVKSNGIFQRLDENIISSDYLNKSNNNLNKSSDNNSPVLNGSPQTSLNSVPNGTNSEGNIRRSPEKPKRERRLTAYQKLSFDLSNDPRCLKEITLGKRIGFYRIRGEIGTGNFSQVKMAVHALTKEKVAVKILNKTKFDHKTQRLLSREITSMERLHHPHIIRLFEVVETLTKLHIVMEYAPGGELFTKISTEGKLNEADANVIYTQVISAIQHIHSKNIIHRDIKAENVFYAGPNYVKVGDFGFSTISRHDQTLATFCGSPPYAAPELFRDESYHGVYVDIWALGILLYFTCTGVMPFRAETVGKLKKLILDGNFTIPVYLSDNCKFLIRSILRTRPRDRFTLDEICRSDWMAKCTFPESLIPFDGVWENESEGCEARKILNDLGITDDHLQKNTIQDSRSNIAGTYRIVMNKVQRSDLDPSWDNLPEVASVSNTAQTNSKTNKKSRLCIIL